MLELLFSRADVRRDRERIPHRKPRAGAATAAHAASAQASAAAAAATASAANDSQQPDQPHSHSAATASSASPDIPRTSAQDIASSGAGAGVASTADGALADGSDLYGSSYTNRRTREADILHDIVRQTRSNFIDVANSNSATTATTTTTTTDSKYGTGERVAEEREERSRIYATNINKHTQLAADSRSDRERRAAPTTAPHLSSSLLTSSLLAAPPVVLSLLSLPLPFTSTHASGAALADLLSAALVRAGDRHWLLSQSQLVSGAIAELQVASPAKLVLAFDELQLPA